MKIMKRLTAFVLVALLLATPALAATPQQQKTADALNVLGLFLGMGGSDGYALDRTLRRSDGITLLVRMIGQEKEAQTGRYSHPFRDVPEWAEGYVAYAYEKGITKGISTKEFGPDDRMSDFMFITLTLRALGYSDSGEDAQFTWNDPYALAKQVGLISYDSEDKDFTRGDAVEIFWAALSVKLNGTDQQLQEKLVEEGVFTAQELRTAIQVQLNGVSGPGTGPVVDPGSSGNSGDENNTGDTNNTGDKTDEKALEDYTWEDYTALTDAEKEALYEKHFGDANLRKYVAWLKELKAEYDARQNIIEIGSGGSVDLGEILNGNG